MIWKVILNYFYFKLYSDESYRAERTKKYVMESEYEFVDDEETTDSGLYEKRVKFHFLKS